MTQPRELEGKGENRARLPDDETDEDHLLADSKLGSSHHDDVNGASEEDALSRSKLGSSDDGGRKGQGGMRDPAKTSDRDRLKPS